MIEIICKYCGEKVEAKRRSKMICNKIECKNKYQNDKQTQYYQDNKQNDTLKYGMRLINQGKRNARKNLMKWNQINREIITDTYYKYDSNPNCNAHICEECGFEYYSYYVTEWGAGYCPNCGLVEKSLIDIDIWEYHLKYQPHSANSDEFNEWVRNLRKVKHLPILKKYAIYFDAQKTIIDFPKELLELRKLLSSLFGGLFKISLEEEEQACWKTLNYRLQGINTIIYQPSMIRYLSKKILQNDGKILESENRQKLKQQKRYRDLGWHPLNNYFENSHGHHTYLENKNDIIYIPSWLHQLYPHSRFKIKSLQEINIASLFWLLYG